MADPISITSTAAGLVSLGIQVYDGLSKYLGAIKARAEELSSARRQADTLRSLLTAIEAALPSFRTEHAAETSPAQACLQACQTELGNLRAALSELEDKTSQQLAGMRGKIAEGKRKLTYPFHRERLERLEQRIHSVNSSLQLAIEHLHL